METRIETVKMEPVHQITTVPMTLKVEQNTTPPSTNTTSEPIEITGENGFMFDERLGDAVRKYKCLYDKNDAGYKQVDTVVEAAWGEVAKETGLANAETAKRLFCNLKKRFLKKRLAFRKANVRGRNKEQLQRAKDAVDAYSFLTWLTPHIRLRETKSNIAKRSQYNTYIESGGTYEDDELYMSEPGEIATDETFAVGTFDHIDGLREDGDLDYRNSPDDGSWSMPTFVQPKERQSSVPHHNHSALSIQKRSTPITSHVQVPISQPIITKEKPWKKEKDDGGAYELMNHYNHDQKPPPLSDDGTEDDCDLFGKLISAELRTLDARAKTVLKHKIQTLIFEAKMTQFQNAPTRVIAVSAEPPERTLHVTSSAHGRWENQSSGEKNSPASPSRQWKTSRSSYDSSQNI